MASPPSSPRRKTERISAGTLVIHEKRAAKAMRDAVDETVDHVSAQLQRRHENERRAAVLLVILGAAKWLTGKLSQAIADERQSARVASGKRFAVEMREAGVEIHPISPHVGMDIDSAHAESAAASLAAQWQTQAVAVTAKVEHPYREISKTRLTMRPRVERTAATEISAAYNDQHARALHEAVERDPELRAAMEAGQIVRRWSAMLDRRTCPECEARDNQILELSDDSPPLHVNCRCITIVDYASVALAA